MLCQLGSRQVQMLAICTAFSTINPLQYTRCWSSFDCFVFQIKYHLFTQHEQIHILMPHPVLARTYMAFVIDCHLNDTCNRYRGYNISNRLLALTIMKQQ
eukprot:205371_1